MLLIATHFSCF